MFCWAPNTFGLVNGESPGNPLVVCTFRGFFAGLCVLRAFIDRAGAPDLPDLLTSRLSRSMFRLPAFRLPDQVAPTLVGWTLDAVVAAPFVVLLLLLLLVTDIGWSRLLLIGGSILSGKEKGRISLLGGLYFEYAFKQKLDF